MKLSRLAAYGCCAGRGKMADRNIFRKFTHVNSGQEFDIAYLRVSNYVETMALDGPKLMLEWDDGTRYIRDALRLAELDEVEAHLSDDWALDGLNVAQKFTVLTSKDAGPNLRINLIAQPMYKIKTIADQTRIFRQRGLAEIIGAMSGGVKVDGAGFPVVEDYHCIQGERPSAMFKQIALEQGAHIWLARDAWKARTFAKLFSQEPAFEYHYKKEDEEFQIINFTKPSQQNRLHEQQVRSFTGWNDEKGRIKSPSTGPVLSKAKGAFASKFSSQNVQTLGNLPTAHRIAIDFMCHGNGFLTPGMVLKLWWHKADPESPLDESLPDKVVIFAVAHYYSAQKYFCRVKGAVPFEPAS